MSRSLMQRRADILKIGTPQPILIHEWSATSYDPATQTIHDTGTLASYDGGSFDFSANSDSNYTIHDDYILFDGTARSYFTMASAAIAALDFGKSTTFEIEWMPHEVASSLNGYLADFGALTKVNEGFCAFALVQHNGWLGGNLKFNASSWSTNNDIPTYIYHYDTTANIRYTLRIEWINNGDSIVIKYILNDEVQEEYEVNNSTELSWDRFAPETPIYIGRSINTLFSYNKPWRFYAIRIYNHD